jgi:hypothetical protein
MLDDVTLNCVTASDVMIRQKYVSSSLDDKMPIAHTAAANEVEEISFSL